MGLGNDTRVKLLFGGVLLSLLALVGVTVFGSLAVLAALFSPGTGSVLAVLFGTVAPFAAVVAMLGFVSVVLLVGLVFAAVRSISLPRSERLARVARLVERVSPEARDAGLAERVEPTAEDRIADLKRAYVEGEIGELEYERRLDDLLDDDRTSGDDRARTGRERTGREREYEW